MMLKIYGHSIREQRKKKYKKIKKDLNKDTEHELVNVKVIFQFLVHLHCNFVRFLVAEYTVVESVEYPTNTWKAAFKIFDL